MTSSSVSNTDAVMVVPIPGVHEVPLRSSVLSPSLSTRYSHVACCSRPETVISALLVMPSMVPVSLVRARVGAETAVSKVNERVVETDEVLPT